VALSISLWLSCQLDAANDHVSDKLTLFSSLAACELTHILDVDQRVDCASIVFAFACEQFEDRIDLPTMCADVDADECSSVEAVNAKSTARERRNQLIVIVIAVKYEQGDLNVIFNVKHNI